MAKKSTKSGKKKLTPLMEQYFKLKSQHEDAILLYRVGDFYETFSSDAIKVSEILGIVLTSRNNGGSDIELAGFPHHSLDVYLPKLVKAGYRVALCEQLEKPSKEKKIVKRGVTDIVTPGLTIDDTILDRKKNNYLASIHFDSKQKCGVSFIDISTGEFLLGEGSESDIEKLIHSFEPSEIIFAKGYKDKMQSLFGGRYYTYPLDEWIYAFDYSREKLLEKFKVNNLKGFAVEEYTQGQIAAGAAIHYLNSTQNENLEHIKSISRIQSENFMWLDRFTIRNLELVHSFHESGVPLIKVLDQTTSPMGARMLKKWTLLPLLSQEKIQARHEVVQFYVDNEELLEEHQNLIRQMGDLERLVSKVSLGKVNPRELIQLKKALQHKAPLKSSLEGSTIADLNKLGDRIQLCQPVKELLEKSILDEPPTLLSKGGVFKDGYNAELDEYNNIIRNSKQLLVDLQMREAEKTGITNLKIGFNNVFGYYLEVTNKYKGQDLIPDDWIRKQTLSNSERYITDELKQLETKILNAQEIITGIEEKLYKEVILEIMDYIDPILANAKIIASLDCMMSFAVIAKKYNYCKPTIDDSLKIDIQNGRHPVIERQLPMDAPYIPNDTYLSNEDDQIMMITGPNMSGKSAILRQTALICLMAQMGSFVPAESATIGIIDKIFTRVGASDNISSGESTFMLEMNETASIMNNISPRSLILLDEIGRGTSTYDGISIAWSLAEYLHNNGSAHPKTLFATHYHELNDLADRYPRIKNYNVATKEIGNKVIFLRKLKEGGSNHSFGIHVARLAGMPDQIISRATEILHLLEQSSISNNSHGENPVVENMNEKLDNVYSQPYQMSIFETSDPTAGKIKELLETVNINNMTPIECMMKLNELKGLLEE